MCEKKTGFRSERLTPFHPTDKRCKKAFQKGSEARKAGKALKDNPYLLDPNVATSSWWQAGFLRGHR